MVVTTTTAHEAIATWLRGYLAERRISHAELARRVDIPQQKFSRKMTGKTPFTIDELTVVVQELGINYAELVNEVGRLRARENKRSNAHGDDNGTTRTREGEPDASSAEASEKKKTDPDADVRVTSATRFGREPSQIQRPSEPGRGPSRHTESTVPPTS